MRILLLYRNLAFRRLVTGVLTLGVALKTMANPHGLTVTSGSATAAVNGSQLTVTASQNAFLNWQSFNIAVGETTIFQQPSASSIVWNRINDQNPSQIFGNLQANGVVVLLNSSGFYFGPNSFVSAAGLVVSTANCLPPQNSGGAWEFNGPPPLASIINYGQIKISSGGSAFLIADRVENHGSIEAPGGAVGLAAGQTVLLSERPDGRGMSMAVTLPQGSVDNEGQLIADGGTIAMRAQVVNQNGFIQANSARNHGGTIELVAADQLNLGADSQILARGDDSVRHSSGGDVTLESGNIFSDDIGSQIITAGGARGGNGGDVEICAPNVRSLNSGIDARARAGWTAGKLLLDPDYIVLDTSGSGSAGSGMVLAGDNPGITLDLNVNTAFANLAVSEIILQAAYDITLAGGTSWDLSGTIGANFGGVTSGQLTLAAGRNIIFGDGASISDANRWSVALAAGYDFAKDAVQSGAGNIYLNGGLGLSGGGSIQTANGNINLVAGRDIAVGSGYVVTTGGGSITAHALEGNIDTGSDAQGYHFANNAGSLTAAYNLQNGLGGISTAAGGDVTLIAVGDITSVLPGKGVYYYNGNSTTPVNGNDYLTAGSGAYGSQPGDVTVVAGGNVTGHYLVANGTGSIFAGVQMDANGNPVTDSSGNYVLGTSGSAGADLSFNGLALSLISGGWNVTAAQNILLQEVRNPNGVFNSSGTFSHYFNYAPGDYVDLTAGNLVQLGASVQLPRLTGTLNNVPVIYPSSLNITAGDGGVILGAPGSLTSLVLFPSPQGSLTIDTTGSLVSALNGVGGAPQLFSLIVSDAGHSQYSPAAGLFGANDHAASPVHLNHLTPVVLNISGDMNLVSLAVPEAAQIRVGGNMNNCGFQGMNLSADDVTSITAGGDIISRSAFTSIDLSQFAGWEAPMLSYLSQAVNNSLSATALSTSFFYNPSTHVLTYQNLPGVNLASVLQLLQNLTVQVYVNGVPQWADPEATIPVTTTVSVLNAIDAQTLLARYNALGPIPFNAGSFGYIIGGGGQFDVTARTIDLGTSAGIQSQGVSFYTIRGNYPLASLFDRGADINVVTTGSHSAGQTASGDFIGDLDMYSSSIVSFNGGNIYVNAGGDINAGSSDFSVKTLAARGIFSTDQGDVSVYANGDINVNGSRIAAYDGGNITVESLNGNVNAGSGGSGFVTVQQFLVDPTTHAVTPNSATIPGSGILATTFPDSQNVVGNIFVETPNGNINTSAGGIIQLSLDQVDSSSATVTLLAGKQAILDTTATGAGAIQIYFYDVTTRSWKLEKGKLQIVDVPFFDPITQKTIVERHVKAEPLLSDRNVITLGSTRQVLEIGSTTPVSLIQILDSGGQPLIDANGHPLYVKIGDPTGQIVEFVSGEIEPYLDVGGNPVNVSTPLDASGLPFPDSLGNPILVMGRNIDANGSGVIGREVFLDATGNITGVFFGQDVSLNALQTVNVTVLAQHTADVAGRDITGIIIAPDAVHTAGGGDPTVLSQDANGSGPTFTPGTAADKASQSSQSEDVAKATDDSTGDQDDEKKKGKQIALAQKTGRVTVILPQKKSAESRTPNPGT